MREPTGFLVEDDDDTRRLFKKILNNKGYNALLAVDEAHALERVVGERDKIDLVVVDLVRSSSEQMLKAGQRILEKGGLNVPLIVIAGEYDEEKQGKNLQVGADQYVCYLEDGTELFDLFFRLTTTPKTEFQNLRISQVSLC